MNKILAVLMLLAVPAGAEEPEKDRPDLRPVRAYLESAIIPGAQTGMGVGFGATYRVAAKTKGYFLMPDGSVGLEAGPSVLATNYDPHLAHFTTDSGQKVHSSTDRAVQMIGTLAANFRTAPAKIQGGGLVYAEAGGRVTAAHVSAYGEARDSDTGKVIATGRLERWAPIPSVYGGVQVEVMPGGPTALRVEGEHQFGSGIGLPSQNLIRVGVSLALPQ